MHAGVGDPYREVGEHSRFREMMRNLVDMVSYQVDNLRIVEVLGRVLTGGSLVYIMKDFAIIFASLPKQP